MDVNLLVWLLQYLVLTGRCYDPVKLAALMMLAMIVATSIVYQFSDHASQHPYE